MIGVIAIEVQNRDEEAQTFKHTLEMSEMAFVQALARRVDFRGERYLIWTPSHHTEERQLRDFLNLKEGLLRLGGISEADLLRNKKIEVMS